MNLRSWAIGRKLLVLSATGLLVALAIGVVSLFSVADIRGRADQRDQFVQVDQGLRQLDLMQNASSSEEFAATAEEMTGQVDNLRQLMQFFTTRHGPGRAAVSAALAVPRPAMPPRTPTAVPPQPAHPDPAGDLAHCERF